MLGIRLNEAEAFICLKPSVGFVRQNIMKIRETGNLKFNTPSHCHIVILAKCMRVTLQNGILQKMKSFTSISEPSLPVV